MCARVYIRALWGPGRLPALFAHARASPARMVSAEEKAYTSRASPHSTNGQCRREGLHESSKSERLKHYTRPYSLVQTGQAVSEATYSFIGIFYGANNSPRTPPHCSAWFSLDEWWRSRAEENTTRRNTDSIRRPTFSGLGLRVSQEAAR